MKKALFACAMLYAFVALSYAGPEEYSGKEMKQVAPAPPACPNWTGFYIGGFGGYKYSNTDINMDLSGLWNGPSQVDIADARVIEQTSPHNLDTSGFELGGVIGYNYQWNRWVLGLEASGGYLWLHNSNETGDFTVAATQDVYRVETSLNTHYVTTFGPRIGYAFCRWLPYVTGGLAVGDIDFSQELVQPLVGSQGGSVSEIKAGWMIGAGLEYAVT